MLGVRALGLARLAVVPAGIALGLRSADVSWLLAVANSVFAVVWILSTNRYMARRGLGTRLTWVIGTVDVGVVVIGLAVTGGVESDMRLLLGVLPLAAAFEFPALVVAAIGVLGAAVIVPMGLGEPERLAATLLVVGWSTVVGLALARDRRALLLRLTAIARTGDRLLEAHDEAAARERERALGVLRDGALTDVRGARVALTAPGGAAEAATRCQAAAEQVRGLVSELHALSARPIVLRTAVAALAARRSIGRRRPIEVVVEEDAQGLRDDLVLVLLRDLLDATAGLPDDEDIRVAVRTRDTCLQVRVAIDGPGAATQGFDELLTAQVRERLAGLPGARLVDGPRRLAAELPVADGGGAPRAQRAPTVRTLVTARVTGGLALLALAALGGVTSIAFWAFTAVGFAAVALTSVTGARRPLSRREILARSAIDQAVLLGALALAAPAHHELLPLIVGFVPIYACVFGPRTVLAMVASLGAGTTVIVGYDPAFLIAFAWAGVVALVLADAAVTATRIIGAQLDRRRVAFLALLASEEQARRSLARRLHDDALQLLLAARQDAEEAAGGDEAARRAEDALREAELLLTDVSAGRDVDAVPAVGLPRALTALARDAQVTGGLTVTHRLDVAADDPRGGLVLGLVRELLANVVRHAGASAASVTLTHDPDGTLTLVVSDDGAGMSPGREAAALAEGHIGLAAARDRVQRRGGVVRLTTVAGRGTTVTVVLPASGG